MLIFPQWPLVVTAINAPGFRPAFSTTAFEPSGSELCAAVNAPRFICSPLGR
jgi:hypothetical protein